MKKKLALLLAALMLILMIPAAPALADPEDEAATPIYAVDAAGILSPAAVNGEGACCLDAETGQVLFEKNADARLFPASITKVMTCLLALDYVEKNDAFHEIVTVPHVYKLEKDAVELYMKKGERFTMEQLLYALMLKSANDAALLLAEHIGGSVESFADMMNAKAQALGMTNTHYVNPNGLHDDNHYTSARDMAILMREAIQNENFRTIVHTMKYTIPATNMTDEDRYCTNSNRLLKESEESYYEPCQGGKTGYTSKAKNTFVCFGTMDGRSVVAAVMHCPDSDSRFLSGRNLLRYGLENFERVDLTALLAQSTLTAYVAGCREDPEEALPLPVRQEPSSEGTKQLLRKREGRSASAEDYTQEVHWMTDQFTAPVAEGDRLGTVRYLDASGNEVLTCGLIAAANAELYMTEEEKATSTTAAETTTTVLGVRTTAVPARKNSVTAMMTMALVILIILIVVVVIILWATARRDRRRQYEEYRAMTDHRNIDEEDEEDAAVYVPLTEEKPLTRRARREQTEPPKTHAPKKPRSDRPKEEEPTAPVDMRAIRQAQVNRRTRSDRPETTGSRPGNAAPPTRRSAPAPRERRSYSNRGRK